MEEIISTIVQNKHIVSLILAIAASYSAARAADRKNPNPSYAAGAATFFGLISILLAIRTFSGT